MTRINEPHSNLYVWSIICAFLPYPVFLVVVIFRWWPPLLLNPVFIVAYVWLAVTCAHWKAQKSRSARLLFLLFPVAFAIPLLLFGFWLWGKSGAR